MGFLCTSKCIVAARIAQTLKKLRETSIDSVNKVVNIIFIYAIDSIFHNSRVNFAFNIDSSLSESYNAVQVC